MGLKYGFVNTYAHKMDGFILKWIVEKTNRSANQTQFLYQLVGGDFQKLKTLEERIKNINYIGCPSTSEEVVSILNTKSENEWFKL